ncbi:MAG TPA: hypothetical protein VMW48_20615, partial [Vicinamibacterales bacterium]|nr:hypothetical protein [Vicinamibacterales bacterium]
MGITVRYSPSAATLAGAAHYAGLGARQEREKRAAEQMKIATRGQDLQARGQDMQAEMQTQRLDYGVQGQQRGIDAAQQQQAAAFDAARKQAEMVDARTRELTANGWTEAAARQQATLDAAAEAQKAGFGQADKAAERANLYDVQRIAASHRYEHRKLTAKADRVRQAIRDGAITPERGQRRILQIEAGLSELPPVKEFDKEEAFRKQTLTKNGMIYTFDENGTLQRPVPDQGNLAERKAEAAGRMTPKEESEATYKRWKVEEDSADALANQATTMYEGAG